MRYRFMFFAIAAAGALATMTAASAAGRAAADACAAGLSAEGKLVYTATIAAVKPGVNLREVVRTKTRGLVINGQLSRGHARAAAEAAGQCLKLAL